ncbi:uncharacterized protein LOC119344710 isoform X1 [Triticum dicoccoides]|uniref:uncharacterized protein LOC119344710 isoform X1 n=1 Tax=Triticum dicoccoides TaxID=85692 RepID=UPI0008458D56|nr:uncharacterized protein LOC119344710 isoform X1 [Triticum dicoccoides]XP_037470967.1 uncharacterized protein LOC119344710 isoform X1 [Triticum dicoccoides]
MSLRRRDLRAALLIARSPGRCQIQLRGGFLCCGCSIKHLNGAHIGMPRFILESLGCLMRLCSSAGRCKAQLRRGSSPVGRHSGATPARTEYFLGYNLPRNLVHMKEKKGIQYLALTLGAWATARTSTYRVLSCTIMYAHRSIQKIRSRPSLPGPPASRRAASGLPQVHLSCRLPGGCNWKWMTKEKVHGGGQALKWEAELASPNDDGFDLK